MRIVGTTQNYTPLKQSSSCLFFDTFCAFSHINACQGPRANMLGARTARVLARGRVGAGRNGTAGISSSVLSASLRRPHAAHRFRRSAPIRNNHAATAVASHETSNGPTAPPAFAVGTEVEGFVCTDTSTFPDFNCTVYQLRHKGALWRACYRAELLSLAFSLSPLLFSHWC